MIKPPYDLRCETFFKSLIRKNKEFSEKLRPGSLGQLTEILQNKII